MSNHARCKSSSEEENNSEPARNSGSMALKLCRKIGTIRLSCRANSRKVESYIGEIMSGGWEDERSRHENCERLGVGIFIRCHESGKRAREARGIGRPRGCPGRFGSPTSAARNAGGLSWLQARRRSFAALMRLGILPTAGPLLL